MKSPIPTASKNNKDLLNLLSLFLKIIATIIPPSIKYKCTDSVNQKTVLSVIRMSRIVPPPNAVSKPIIKIPNGSNFLLMAFNAPEIANVSEPKRLM